MQEMNREQIIPVNIEEEMAEAYIDYSMSVIIGRALPDVRDGLKPVHRRIIYAMHRAGMASNKPHSKCAGVVGDVLGKFHPHGDMSVYDALVRMAQPWNLRYPLIDGQGNFGSIDGDSPAAYRYTECRLSKIAELLLTDIEKNTVEFAPNFDGKEMEPLVMPSAFPNLLVNGSAGIAVGMATNIPPHNLGEVVDALQIALKKCKGDLREFDPKSLDLREIMQVMPGPDFPTAGYIHGRQGILDAFSKGRGKISIRARMNTEQLKGGREAIIVTEIPYQVNKTKLIEDIAALVRDKRIPGISDLRDESDRDGMRMVFELRRGEPAQVVMNQLYKFSQMEVSFGIIMLALVENRPRYLPLTTILVEYLKHRGEIVVRRTRFDLDKARKRIHIVLGLRIAVDNIDEVIKIIRSSASTENARERLVARFGLTEIQATEILNMPLRRLTGLERENLEKEHKELVALIEDLASILADPGRVKKIISKELGDVRDKHADKRMTEIVDSGEEMTMEDMIAEERVVITVSHEGYIKRTPTNVYRNQRRGGRGASGMDPKENDWVEHVFIGTTHNYLLCITDRGKAYWLKVYELPSGGKATRGRPIINLLELEAGENIKALLPVDKFSDDRFLIMATRKGQIVKNALSLYSNPRKAGIKAINVDDDDELIGAKISNGRQEIFMGTRKGMAVRFEETDVRPMGRFVGGVRGIRLRGDDEVIGLAILTPGSSILTVCANGFGKRTEAEEYRKTARGGMGVINIKTTDRNGDVIGLLDVIDADQLIMISNKGITLRVDVSSLRKISRATQGVNLMKCGPGDTVSAIARIEEDKDIEGEGGEGGDAAPEGEAPTEGGAPAAE